MTQIGEALRLLRVFHDIKQIDLAKRLEISKSHISEVEKGIKTPSLGLIDRYANEFSIPVSSIMFFRENMFMASSISSIDYSVHDSVKALLLMVKQQKKVNKNHADK